MHRCSSSSGNHIVGACSCGVFHNQTNAFSMLFSMSNNKPFDEYSEMYPFTSSSSPVDCTLSLGTPSTRLTCNPTAIAEKRVVVPRHDQRSSFYWDILQTKHASSPPPTHKNCRGNNMSNNTAASGSSGACGGDDRVLARRCANCDTTSTPLWRNGPRGPKSLCNACGIRFKKEERRATASVVNGEAAASVIMEPQHMINNSWVQHSQTHKTGNEMPFVGSDSDSGIPFLSWRLNVTDRPSLIHDFTR